MSHDSNRPGPQPSPEPGHGPTSGGAPDGAELLALLLDGEATDSGRLEAARRDPRQGAELAELESFLDHCREAARMGERRQVASGRSRDAVARILASTTREDLGIFGDLRLMRRFLRDRWSASAAVRVAAASLLAHVAAVPVLAWVALRPAPEERTLQIQWELPQDAFPEPDAETLRIEDVEVQDPLLGGAGDGESSDTGPGSKTEPEAASSGEPARVAAPGTSNARWVELNRRRVERYRLWQVRESAQGLDSSALASTDSLHPWLRLLALRLEAAPQAGAAQDVAELLEGLESVEGMGPMEIAVARGLAAEWVCDQRLAPGGEFDGDEELAEFLASLRSDLLSALGTPEVGADPSAARYLRATLFRVERMSKPAGDLEPSPSEHDALEGPDIGPLLETAGLAEHPLAGLWLNATR